MANGTLINFQVMNDEKVVALLKRTREKAKDLRIPLKQSIAMRRKKGRGAKILQDTGRGKSSIVYKVVSNQKVQIGTNLDYMRIHQEGGSIKMPARDIYPVKARALHWVDPNTGEDVFAMHVHQKARTVKIPQRKFLLYQEEDKKNIVKIFTEYLEEIVR